MGRKSLKYYDMIMVLFVTVLIMSNILSSAKIVDWRMSLLGIPLAFDAGTILFPVSYIFGDILTEVYGYRRSRRVIWMGFSCLILSSLLLYFVKLMPGEGNWEKTVGQGAYDAVLSGMTSGGIVAASLLGYWLGEFSNSYVLAKMKILTGGRWLWTRTVGSTLVGEGLDTLVFVSVAVFCGVFPAALFTTLVVTNYLFKVGVEAAMTPATYLVVGVLKKAEQEDYYDYRTNFNPFSRGSDTCS
ncbi:MAG: queuosine precursor transporter [Pseudomonadota bacterium]|nr:queuosine precursor transporter [Pseudomonadota bacterium]